MEKNLNRPVSVRPRGRPRNDDEPAALQGRDSNGYLFWPLCSRLCSLARAPDFGVAIGMDALAEPAG